PMPGPARQDPNRPVSLRPPDEFDQRRAAGATRAIVAQASRPKQATGRAMLSRPVPALTPISAFDAVQAVGGVLAGEEHHVGIGGGLAGMHGVRGHIDDRARLGLDLLVADLRPER